MSAATPSPPAPGHGLDRDATDRLSAAKLWLVSTESPTACGDMPYLSAALYALIPVATTRVAQLSIDQHWRLYLNPTWMTATDIPVVAARLAHLTWHLLADHAARALDLDVGPNQTHAWQSAADATVADVLDTPELTTGLAAPTTFGWAPGRSAEEYFAYTTRLSTHPRRPDTDQPPAPDLDEPDTSCGSGCDGRGRAYDLPPGDKAGGVDSHDADAIRRRVAIEFRDHQTNAGTIPGEWARWVQHTLDPIVPWQQVLAAAVRRGIGWAHGHTDYTYTKVSRRQAGAGPIVLPALRRPKPEVAVVIDTSGSIDDGLLAQALGEVNAILATHAVPDGSITVLAVDAAVQGVTRVRSTRDVQLAGGGGTDMGTGIDAALALKPRPTIIIVLTDGYTPWPAHPPTAAVIAVLIARGLADLPPTPTWVQRVECVSQ